MIYLYRAFYSILKILVQTYAELKPEHQISNWVKRREVALDIPKHIINPIWFHAASGEIEYCKSVIQEIKKQAPHQKIILSYSSPSAEKLLTNLSVDYVFPLPWDTRRNMKNLVLDIKPKTVVFSRTDFWPELIHQLNIQRVPMAAISVFTQVTFFKKYYLSWVFKNFKFISVVTRELETEMKLITSSPVYYFSDSRYDQVFNRLTQPSRVTLEPNRKYIVMGSMWPEDQEKFKTAVKFILQYQIKLIWCPHDVSPKYIENILNTWPELALVRLSDYLKAGELPFQILVVDQVGYLADFYRFSDFAFIGGSFKDKVHSVMEALCAQNIVFFGPHYLNNPEAIEALEHNFAYIVHSGEEMLEVIKGISSDELPLKKNQIKDYTQNQTGASEKLAQHILNLKDNT